MRYEVIRYPTYWVVIDHAHKRKIVFEGRNLDTVRRYARKLNQKVKAA